MSRARLAEVLRFDDEYRQSKRAARVAEYAMMESDVWGSHYLAQAYRSVVARPQVVLLEACRAAGLRYWQHIIVLDHAANIPAAAPAAAPRRGTAPIRSRRAHRDMLVFRRAPETVEAASGAAAEAVAA